VVAWILFSVVVYVLLFTALWCSVDTGEYYVVSGHVLSCVFGGRFLGPVHVIAVPY
jgi:hypothetical protein